MINLQKIVDDLFKDINRIRSNPLHYAQTLRNKESHYMNDIYRPQGKFIQTKQGLGALRDACTELQRTQKSPPLIWSFALHVLADEQALYLGSTGAAKGDQPLADRVPKYALATGRINEIIQLSGTSSEQILHELIVDDGLVSRRRRKTILDPTYKYIGIASAKHKTYGYVTVLIFAEQIHELLKPTNELVQLEVNKNQKRMVDPNQNYYKMKKPPVYNQLKHFKRSHVVVPPPPPPPPPAVMRSLKNSQVMVPPPLYVPQFVQEPVQPIIQEHQVEVIKPVYPEPVIVQTPVYVDPHPQVMLNSINRSTLSNQAPLITTIPSDPHYEVIHDPRLSSEVGLLASHPQQQIIVQNPQDFRGTIIHPPEHVQMINRLSQFPMQRLAEPAEQNPGFCQKCSTSSCLLF